MPLLRLPQFRLDRLRRQAPKVESGSTPDETSQTAICLDVNSAIQRTQNIQTDFEHNDHVATKTTTGEEDLTTDLEEKLQKGLNNSGKPLQLLIGQNRPYQAPSGETLSSVYISALASIHFPIGFVTEE
eukprot:gene659-3967_t